VAVTTQGGAIGDTESIAETLPEAAEAVAGADCRNHRRREVSGDFAGVEEVVADKGYHSNEVLRDLAGTGSAGLHRRAGTRDSQVEGTDGRTSGGVCQSQADSGSARQTVAGWGAGNGWSGTLRISSIPEAWTGCCPRSSNVHKKLLIQLRPAIWRCSCAPCTARASLGPRMTAGPNSFLQFCSYIQHSPRRVSRNRSFPAIRVQSRIDRGCRRQENFRASKMAV